MKFRITVMLDQDNESETQAWENGETVECNGFVFSKDCGALIVDSNSLFKDREIKKEG